MKRLIVIATCLMFAGISKADKPAAAPTDKPAAPILQKPEWEIGFEVFSDKYEEPDVMQEEGTFYGIVLANTSYGAGKIDMTRFEGEFAYGKLDYDGHLMDGTPYTMSDLKDYLFDLRILGGRDFTGNNGILTPYWGLGYRWLHDDSTSDPAGYKRYSNYLYLPLGLMGAAPIGNDGWSIGATGEFDILLLGLQTSDFGWDTIHNRQNPFSGYGLRGAISLANKQSGKIGFKIEPFVRYWDIDESELENTTYGAFVEPANTTTQYGIQLYVTF
jgi:hypothetical protein